MFIKFGLFSQTFFEVFHQYFQNFSLFYANFIHFLHLVPMVNFGYTGKNYIVRLYHRNNIFWTESLFHCVDVVYQSVIHESSSYLISPLCHHYCHLVNLWINGNMHVKEREQACFSARPTRSCLDNIWGNYEEQRNSSKFTILGTSQQGPC